jgi:serine/threonine protein kinase
VVIVHDLLEPGGPFRLRDYFIIMEYMAGGSLKDYLEQAESVSVERAVRLTIDVLRGLVRAHRQGIVHRDIKPGNVLVNEDASLAKVGDWGLVHLPDSTTTIGGQPGTIVYMSAEQAESMIGSMLQPRHWDGRQRAIDGRSDLYSVGAMLYEMVAGHYYLDFNRIMRQARAAFLRERGLDRGQELPFRERRELDDATYAAWCRAIVLDPPDPLPRDDDPLARALEPMLFRALAKSPSDRYQSPEAMIEALEALLRPAPPPTELRVTDSSDGESVGALLERARTAREQHRYADAVQLLERAKERAPRRVRVYTELAAVYNRMNSEREACCILEQAKGLAPDDPSVLRTLALTYHKLGDIRKALDVLGHLLELPASQSAATRALKLKWEREAEGGISAPARGARPAGGWRVAD